MYSTVSTLKPGERGSCREEVGEEAEASEKKRRRRRSKGEEKKRKKDSSGDEKTLSLSPRKPPFQNSPIVGMVVTISLLVIGDWREEKENECKEEKACESEEKKAVIIIEKKARSTPPKKEQD